MKWFDILELANAFFLLSIQQSSWLSNASYTENTNYERHVLIANRMDHGCNHVSSKIYIFRN